MPPRTGPANGPEPLPSAIQATGPGASPRRAEYSFGIA